MGNRPERASLGAGEREPQNGLHGLAGFVQVERALKSRVAFHLQQGAVARELRLLRRAGLLRVGARLAGTTPERPVCDLDTEGGD